jgi:hypothetical protein
VFLHHAGTKIESEIRIYNTFYNEYNSLSVI